MSGSKHTGVKAFRRDIEGLRGIAVLLVVAYHAGLPGLGGGFVGVDVFFVLSGYLITMLLEREITENGRIDLAAFYARRVKRLLPAAGAVIIFTMVGISFLYAPATQIKLSKSALAASLYISNMWSAAVVGDYFGRSAEGDPLLHMWSLSVEEQFYFLWPILILVGAHGTKTRKRLLGVMLTVAILSFAGSWWFSIANKATAFYWAPWRAWEFAVGGILSLMPRGKEFSRSTRGLCSFVGFTLVVGSAIYLSEASSFPGLAAIPVVLGTLLLLSLGHFGVPEYWLSRVRGLQWLGKFSYSWYLWHWPLLVFFLLLWPEAMWWEKGIIAGGALLPAMVSYYYIENYFRYGRRSPQRTLFTGFGVTLLLAGLAQAGQGRAEARGRSEPYVTITQAGLYGTVESDGCVVDVKAEDPGKCIYGTGEENKIVLFGDSHSAHWGSSVLPFLNRGEAQLFIFTKSGCPAPRVLVRNKSLGRRYIECETWRERALKEIEKLAPKTVVISSSQVYFKQNEVLGEGDAYIKWQRGLQEVLAEVSPMAERVLLIQGTPWMGKSVPECLASIQRGWGMKNECEVQRVDAIDEVLAQLQREVAQNFENVLVVDLTDVFCSEKQCGPLVSGVIAYRDASHISTAIAEIIAREWIHFLSL